MIQLAQNGKKGQGVNLETAPGVPLRPVFFEGISGVSVPMPQQQQPSPVPVQQQQKQPLPQSPKQNQQIVSPNQRQFVAQPPMQQQNANQYGQPQSPLRQPIQGPDMVQNSQHQPSTPPRPPHPQINVGGAVMRSVALTVQDPYTLTPSEQARYEQLFGDFAKSDGYCYGPEAVGLFGKSGLPQPQLAAIWNMVDNPVDNRLDKLEFAIAMHLIVCVTKKNLPFPPALPLPLKQLKSQLPPSQVSNASSINLGMAQQTQRTSAADGGAISISGAGTKTPMVNTGMQGVDSNYSVDGGSNFGIGGGEAGFQSGMQHGRMGSIDSLGGNLGPSGMQGPPPLQPSGGASISDAFEGLVGSGDSESVSTYRPPTPPMQVSNVPENKNMYSPEPMVMPVVSNSLQSPAKNMKASVNRPGDSVGDMEQLRGALQKLQAENISLKAKLSTMAGEEDDVRKELMETVTEITTLSSQLTTLRAQVLGAKSRLLEVTGELSAAKEKKRYVLIHQEFCQKIIVQLY